MRATSRLIAVAACVVALSACANAAERAAHRVFTSPEDAARALNAAVVKGSVDEVLAIFGPDGRELLDSSDPAAAQRRRAVFAAAFAERWNVVDDGGRTWLIVGHEAWPFPVPLVKDGGGWRFDTAAGKDEILARRIGRNELAAVRACRAYVAAQRRYARTGHDGKRPGLYASVFRSDPGKENGLYWAAMRGRPRSPLGDLLSGAAIDRHPGADAAPAPFYGYRFRILTAQGESAPGGAMDYVDDGELARGFALIAWPARYDSSGIMTFIVNHEGVVYQRDLGPDTDALARRVDRYDPDASWSTVE